MFNYFYVFGCQKFDLASVTADKLDFESSFSLTMQQNTICDVSDHTSLVTSHNLPLSHLVSLSVLLHHSFTIIYYLLRY